MTEHQKAFHKRSAIMSLILSVFVFCIMVFVQLFHRTSRNDEQGILAVSAIATIVFGLMWVYCWKVGRVSIRSVRIERKSEPKAYRLTMTAFLIVILTYVASFLWNSYLLLKHSA